MPICLFFKKTIYSFPLKNNSFDLKRSLVFWNFTILWLSVGHFSFTVSGIIEFVFHLSFFSLAIQVFQLRNSLFIISLFIFSHVSLFSLERLFTGHYPIGFIHYNLAFFSHFHSTCLFYFLGDFFEFIFQSLYWNFCLNRHIFNF